MRYALSFVFLFFAVGSITRADDAWTLTTADFAHRQVLLRSLDNRGAMVVPNGQVDQQFIPLADFLQVDRPVSAAVSQAKFVLHLVTSDQLPGQPVSLADEQLLWKSPTLGTLSIPLRQLIAITRAGQSVPSQEKSPKDDVVILANSDTVRGIVSSFDATTVTIQKESDSVPVPLDSIACIVFASTAVSQPAPERGFRVRLNDESSLVVSAIKLSDSQINLTLTDNTNRKLDLSNVMSIEQVNGPVSWLSSRTPSENIQTPLLEMSWPARMNRTVGGQPIRFGYRVFSQGIGVHAYSRLTYPLTSGYEAFRTQYAIDGAGTYADVTVRIKLDGRVVHEQSNVRAGILSPVITVSLAGAKAITLEVDYGLNHDVQDRFNWIEPALLRVAPRQSTPTRAKSDSQGLPSTDSLPLH